MATTKSIPMGRLVMTRAFSDVMADDTQLAKRVTEALPQHVRGVCPHMPREDQRLNRMAISDNEPRGHDRMFTVWPSGRNDEPKFWIITEIDRSVTTILFPSDY